MRRFTHLAPTTARRRRQCIITVPDTTWNQVNQLGTWLGRRPTEVIQTALDLLQVAADETRQDHLLAVVTPDGTILQQIVIGS